MKVESTTIPYVPTSPLEDLPIIKAEEIKTILYLGIRGNVKLESGTGTTVDTYA